MIIKQRSFKWLQDNVVTYEDVCYELNIPVTDDRDFIYFPEEQRGKLKATTQLLNIVKLFNQGWVPNFDNTSEYKYLPYFVKNSGGWAFGSSIVFAGRSYCSAGLYYKSRELSDFCANRFLSIYLNYIK